MSYSRLPIHQITAGGDVPGTQFPTYKRAASDITNLNSELLPAASIKSNTNRRLDPCRDIDETELNSSPSPMNEMDVFEDEMKED